MFLMSVCFAKKKTRRVVNSVDSFCVKKYLK